MKEYLDSIIIDYAPTVQDVFSYQYTQTSPHTSIHRHLLV
jgi:hypothetical protein